VSHLAVAKVAKTFGIAGQPKLLASFATTVIPWPFLIERQTETYMINGYILRLAEADSSRKVRE